MAERIVVSGGTGYVGRALVPRLAAGGREVVVLSRSGRLPPDLARVSGVRAVAWDAQTLGDFAREIDGAHGVFHLAGERAVGVRFTAAMKRRILESRVKSAEALVQAIARAERKPGVFVSASGVDYYGAQPDDRPCDETAPPGADFLSDVCVAWEEAARLAEPLGVRVVCTRFGVVLGPGGGAVATMALPYRLFAGGPLGHGRQIFSWVSLEDTLAALERAYTDSALKGPVNVTAPNAVSQNELAAALGRALHRPAWMRVPGFALKLLFGEGATPILTGKRVVPAKLQAAGFQFRYPTVDEALAAALG